MASRGSAVVGAGANIYPCTIVKLSTVTGETGKVLQAGAGDTPYGVSQAGTRNAPLTSLNDGYCGSAGEVIRVYTAADPEDMPYIQVDAAYAQGQTIKPGTNGIGTATTADGDIYIGILMEASTVANQLVQIRVTGPQYRGA
jgi:hypothetical protein